MDASLTTVAYWAALETGLCPRVPWTDLASIPKVSTAALRPELGSALGLELAVRLGMSGQKPAVALQLGL